MGSLINAARFQVQMETIRKVYIGGHVGVGKTSLAHKLAEPFLRRGYRFVTNIRSVWADDPEQVKPINKSGHYKAIVLVDEGGAVMRSTEEINTMFQFPAKMDLILMVSSESEPVRSFQSLQVRGLYSYSAIGIPLTVYKWRLSQFEKAEGGMFFWWKPSDIYGVYSRQDPGAGLAPIMDWLLSKSKEYQAIHGREGNDDLLRLLAHPEVSALREAAEDLRAAEDALSLRIRGSNKARSNRR